MCVSNKSNYLVSQSQEARRRLRVARDRKICSNRMQRLKSVKGERGKKSIKDNNKAVSNSVQS